MNKSRLFRGKSKETGKWVVGWHVFANSCDYILEEYDACGFNGCQWSEEWYEEWTEVHPETVGQSTGRKDKNGVERYEGNLESHEGDMYEIVWCEKFSGFFWRIVSKAGADAGRIVQLGEPDGTEGNIHENPELIEAKE